MRTPGGQVTWYMHNMKRQITHQGPMCAMPPLSYQDALPEHNEYTVSNRAKLLGSTSRTC
jgi:hypothetical protein